MTDPRALSLLALAACSGEAPPAPAAFDDPFTPEEAERVLRLSPLPALPPDPTNAWADDPAAAALGESLFFDPRLSADGTVACATCHDPEAGWADGETLSAGVSTTRRHAPSVWNTAHNRWYFWDGRADSAWAQALGPLEDPGEHGFDRVAAYGLVAGDPELAGAYAAVFGPLPPLALPPHARPVPSDPAHPDHLAWEALDTATRDEVDRFWSRVGKAIAAFERTILTGRAPIDDVVDAYRAADAEAFGAVDPAIVEGLGIFVGRGNCHFCHLGPGLTNGEFHNIGLGERSWLDLGDRGRFDGVPIVLADPFNGVGPWSDDPSAGAEKLDHLVQSAEGMGQFKVPTLRNVALTAPYMHGGHFATLDEVVTFYSELQELPVWGHREDLMVRLDLTPSEIASVVAFLESLTAPAE